MISCGVDIGARTVKIVVLDNGEILDSQIQNSGARPKETASAVFDSILKKIGITPNDIGKIIATGYGRNHFDKADGTLSEIICHGAGCAYYFPASRLIVDIGGQDSKMIRTGPGGKVLDFAMNDRCAAGTGRFIEMVAQILDLSIEEVGPLALQSEETCEISSMCAVFAESEIIGLLQRGTPAETILRGVFNSVAKRTVSLMRGISPGENLVFTGGVARNPGVAAAMGEETGKKILIPPDPGITGALGAAILASGS